ncbi:CHAT domain-containing protein [Leptospira mtsangambouensis]|uniref:CHAT domain-containing protein n=1 Tax=Leptospira mtsangambouensis TaxID=2484912 RepID=A0ABY2NZP0_9LEPT|nr:CHAT domain-containing protein [Leptospira mtsangambouensis]MCG6140526.1 CHAT domain-containing protein [Leptospira mtsangambouensis]TGM74834.1 CHAT domain-containing protein [Leptospira mtsangambouensis]
MLSLIIDRVGNVNIFNVLEDNLPVEESHIQSTLDDDLIFEYLGEVERLVHVSQSVLSNSNQILNADILQDLKVLGETFYQQFFPASIIEKLKNTTKHSIHFNIDPALALIPWELLHDGASFLSDKFRIGKTIRGGLHRPTHHENRKIKMLIIADPTEDLPHAQKEGEVLFSVLSQKVPTHLLELEFIGGKQVTKLKLLSLIKDKHIIHYSGHLHFSDDSLENGWLLSDGKVLKAREIKSTGIDTDLVFSNSCMSAKSAGKKLNPNILNQYAGAFLTAGIKTFVGTNWEILDNERTIDFTVRFYTFLFSDKSVGESLYLSKEFARRNYHANDLTWANYALYGNPDFSLFVKDRRNFHSAKILNPTSVIEFYPTPIAVAYSKLINSNKAKSIDKSNLVNLIKLFEAISQVVGMMVFSDHAAHAMNKSIPNNPDDAVSLRKWWELVYGCVWDFQKLKISSILEVALPVLHEQKETIFKIVGWMESWEQEEIKEEEIESYQIIMQFFLENMLLEFSELEKVSVLLVSENQNPHFYFKGIKPAYLYPSSPGSKDKLQEQLSKHKGNLVLVHENRKIVIPFPTYFKERKETGDLELVFNGLTPFAPGAKQS